MMSSEALALAAVIVAWDRWKSGDEKGAVEAMRAIGEALHKHGFARKDDSLTPVGYGLAAQFEDETEVGG